MGQLKSRKTYYLFNPVTLEYERQYPSKKERFVAAVKNFCLGLVISVAAFFGFLHFFESPKEAMYRKENKLLQTQYALLLREINEANEVLEDLRQRDEHLYRAILNADSIPESIRKSGFGGSNRYEHLKGVSNSDLIIETTQKMDMLKKQLYVQINSLDELIGMGKDLDNQIKCLPAIMPISIKDLNRITSGLGWRPDPFYGISKYHTGMDFTADLGTDIYATGNGTVTFAGRKQDYGYCVMIDHGYGYQTLYGHLSKYKVKVGQKVVRGEVIAAVGNTGKSKGSHLHYEVIYKGRYVNPANYYFQDLTPEEYDKMIQIAENHGQVMD